MRNPLFVRSGLALAALALVAAPGAAIPLNGSGVLSSAAFRPEIGDEALVHVSNTGRKPLRVEILLLDADDFSVVASSGELMVEPRTTGSAAFIPSDFPVLVRAMVVIRYRAPGRTSARVSLQVRDAAGATQIFTDGFESGDLSS